MWINITLHSSVIEMTSMLCRLQIDCAAEEHEGSYLCSISNVLEERWTEPVDVDIGKSELCLLCPNQLRFFTTSTGK